MSQLQNVSVDKGANIYFDGLCVSHTVTTAEGERKSVGVIFPATLTFGTEAPEVMELVAGRCRVKLPGSDDWQEFAGGEQFSVPGNSNFEIEVTETLQYVCHFD